MKKLGILLVLVCLGMFAWGCGGSKQPATPETPAAGTGTEETGGTGGETGGTGGETGGTGGETGGTGT